MKYMKRWSHKYTAIHKFVFILPSKCESGNINKLSSGQTQDYTVIDTNAEYYYVVWGWFLGYRNVLQILFFLIPPTNYITVNKCKFTCFHSAQHTASADYEVECFKNSEPQYKLATVYSKISLSIFYPKEGRWPVRKITCLRLSNLILTPEQQKQEGSSNKIVIK